MGFSIGKKEAKEKKKVEKLDPRKIRTPALQVQKRAFYRLTHFIRAKRVSNCYMREKKTDRLCGCVCVDARLISWF